MNQKLPFAPGASNWSTTASAFRIVIGEIHKSLLSKGMLAKLGLGLFLTFQSIQVDAQDPVHQFTSQEMMGNSGTSAGDISLQSFRRLRANIITDASQRGGVFQLKTHRFTADYLDNNTLLYSLYHSSAVDANDRLIPVNNDPNKIGATIEVSGLSGGISGIDLENYLVEQDFPNTDFVVDFNSHSDYWVVIEKVEGDRGAITNYSNVIGNGSARADSPAGPWSGFGRYAADIEAFEISPALTGVSVSNIQGYGATLQATSHKNATGYYLVVPNGSTAPTPLQIIIGGNYGGVSVAASGAFPMNAGMVANTTVAGLDPNTAYQTYVVGVSTVGSMIGRRTLPLSFTTGDPNTAPSISAIDAQAICLQSNFEGVQFTVSDNESAAGTLTVTATSSNTSLVPNANIVISGTGADRTVSVTPVAGQSGSATIQLTVTDQGGLTETSSFNFTVRELPVAGAIAIPMTCPDSNDGSVSVSATGGQAPYTFLWSNNETATTLNSLGPDTYTVSVTDAHGCKGNGSVEVVNGDDEAPNLLTKDFSLQLGPSGVVVLTPTLVRILADNGCTDNCGIDNSTFALSTMTFNCTHLGEHSYTFSVSDVSGNTATSEIMIDVIDPFKPTAVANDLELQLDADGLATLSPMDADAGSTDNCAIAGRSLSKTSFDCSEAGEHDVVLTVSDAQGNTDQKSFKVNVIDDSSPVMTFVASPRVYLNASGLGMPEQEHLIGTLNDNCGVANTSFSIEEFDCSNLGFTPMTIIAQDFHGNLTEISGQVQVVDTIKPTFDLTTIQLDIDAEGNATLTEALLIPHANDACGIAEVAIQKSNWTCDESGGTTQIIVFDMNGNAIQRTIEVTLEDHVAPAVSANDIVVHIGESGFYDLSLDALDYTATDNCQLESVFLSRSRITCQDQGTVQVTITGLDAVGNIGSSTFNVTVIDDQAPILDCSGFTSICAGVYDFAGRITVKDNCSVNLIQTTGPEVGEELTAGEHFVEFMATDPSGNSTTCSTTIEVLPTPVADLGEDLMVEEGQTVTLTAGNNPDNTYEWSTGETAAQITVLVQEDMTISVTVSNANGCSTTDEVNITATLGLSTSESVNGNLFKLYPNPTTDAINMSFGLQESLSNAVITIFDLQGKLLQSKQVKNIENGQVISLDVSQLPQGLYMATITTETERMTARFSKK